MTILNKIKLENFIGCGSFGLVFSAKNPTGDEQFAIKFIDEENCLHGKIDSKKVERESIPSQKEPHPNIVQVFEYVDEFVPYLEISKVLNEVKISEKEGRERRDQFLELLQGYPTLKMKFIRLELLGDDLKDWIADHSLAGEEGEELEKVKLHIIKDLVEGVRFLHSLNLTHRDLKPANALFAFTEKTKDYKFPIKIGDFGLCREMLGDDTLTVGVGTEIYRAPEVNTELYTHQADIYSLGFVIYEVIMLFKTKQERNDHFKLLKTTQDNAALNSDKITKFPIPNTQHLILSMCKEDVAERMKSLTELGSVFKDIGDSPCFGSVYHGTVVPGRRRLLLDLDVLNQVIEETAKEDGFENLKFLEQIGRGGFGAVYKTMNLQSNKETATKILYFETEDESQILREYNNVEHLEHSNLVKLHRVHEPRLTLEEIKRLFPNPEDSLNRVYAKGYSRQHYRLIFIEMELCGSSLREWIRQMANDPSPDPILQMTQFQIVHGVREGLGYLHGHNVLHRDMKPENIMFSSHPYVLPVKIGDFGLSRKVHLDNSTTSSLTSGVGTTMYMAPEVHSGQYDHQADIYSFGLITMEILQLIRFTGIRIMFDRIVNNQDYQLITEHSFIKNAKELIISMTKGRVHDRMKDLSEMQFVT